MSAIVQSLLDVRKVYGKYESYTALARTPAHEEREAVRGKLESYTPGDAEAALSHFWVSGSIAIWSRLSAAAFLRRAASRRVKVQLPAWLLAELRHLNLRPHSLHSYGWDPAASGGR